MSVRDLSKVLYGILVALIFSVLRGDAQTATVSEPGQPITLPALVAEAEEQNPELRAAFYEREAVRQRVRPAGALPDPVISFGQMNTGNIVPFTTLGETEMTRISIGIEQDFPLFGKRSLREKLAAEQAEAETWRYESIRLRILSELKVAYYELFFQYRALESLQRTMELLETFEETASAMYRVGRATQADVLRAQTELTRLQEQIELATQRQQAAEAEINSLLNRPADSLLSPPAEFEKAALERSYEDLLKLAMERFPLLRQQQEIIASRQYAMELAEKERYPDVGAMFAYHNRGGLKDLWEIAGTVRVPLYFGRKQKYEIEAASAELSAAKNQQDALRAAVQFKLKDAFLEATTAQRLLALLEQTIIPQETMTLEATSSSYQVGAADSLAVIQSLVQLTEDQVRYYEYLTRFHQALARMEPLVGEELTR